MNNYPVAEHDRMIAAMLQPCVVTAVDLNAGKVRVKAAEWVSAWVRWHSVAAGKARHWRSPSVGEQGVLFSPSGVAAVGTFIPGLYGNAGLAPDNRDHVEVWRFDDGGSLVYDWEAKSYRIDVPTGRVTVQVAGTVLDITDNQVRVVSDAINLTGSVIIDGTLNVTQAVSLDSTLHAVGDISSDASIMDVGGNSNHHTH